MTKTTLILCAGLLLASASSFAQTAPVAPAPTPASAAANNGQPIEITATKTVEWLRNEKQYVARENVIVTQGTMQLFSDLLTADYRETEKSSQDIWQMTATGNVQIKDETNTAYGDKAVYDVPTGVAVLTGENLRLVSPEQTVTATDRMEYHSNERLAKAIGNAKVVRAKDTLTANTITAFFKDDSAPKPAAAKPDDKSALGGGNLDRLEADGNVVIITPTEKLTGNKGVYRADTNTAEITGKVKIERGENILEGNRAEVNLTTNVSKMFGSDKPGGRVRGVFFPGSDKSPATKKPATPPSNPPANGGKAGTPTPATNTLPPPSGGIEGGVSPALTTNTSSPEATAPAKVSRPVE